MGAGSSTLGTDYEIKNAAVTAVYATQIGTDSGVVAFRHGTDTLSYNDFTTSGHTLTVGSERNYAINGFLPLVLYISSGLVLAAADSGDSNAVKVYLPGVGDVKALGISAGRALGETAYVTGWSNSGELTLSVIDVTTPAISIVYSLGSASESELDARTWVAYPHSPFALGDEFLYVYGRMNNPAGLGTVHIIYSEDYGASWVAIEAAWGSDHCGSLIEDFGTILAIRNISGASPKLYMGDVNGLVVRSTLIRSSRVNPFGMVYDWFSGTIHVGFATGGSVMVIRANDPFTEWVDITYNHQTGNGVKAIMVL